MMYAVYKTITYIAEPLIPALLQRRLRRGKEDAARVGERTGITSIVRPPGRLVWIHAASVGESNSVLPLIHAMLAAYPSIHILLTTVTVTSAKMMGERLPARALHQFAPVDSPDAVAAFLYHWQPDIALWVDSELWPNILMETRKRGAVMGIINARMSERSFRSWRFARPLIRQLLSCFSLCFAQSVEDGSRLLELGIPAITATGNLKYDAAPLPYNEEELVRLRAAIGARPLWIAASTHLGEETIIGEVHAALKQIFPDLLTLIVPRHAKRGGEIAEQLRGFHLVQRSKKESITPETDIYLGDTMGELGMFYRLAPIAFIGGTLVPHGGQNPLEAARTGCAIIMGQHAHNFRDMVSRMEQDKAVIGIHTREELRDVLKQLLGNKEMHLKLGDAAMRHVQSGSGMIERIMNELRPYLS